MKRSQMTDYYTRIKGGGKKLKKEEEQKSSKEKRKQRPDVALCVARVRL